MVNNDGYNKIFASKTKFFGYHYGQEGILLNLKIKEEEITKTTSSYRKMIKD